MFATQRFARGVLLMISLALVTHRVDAADWLRFRGPNGLGVAPDHTAVPITWNESQNVRWKTELPGPGSSCPIVVGDKVFVTCWSGYGVDRENPGDQSQLKRHLICIDRNNGNVLWDQSVDPYLPEDEYGGMFAEHGYASHTPVSDGERVYVFFGKTGVLAFDLDGKQLWQTSVGTESGMSNWGTASSPLLYKNLLIVPATAESQSLVGLDKMTGEEVWRQEAAGFGSVWGSPILVEVDADRTDLVIAVPGEVWGFNPETGKMRWYCEAMPNRSICSSAVAKDGVIYAIESGPGGGGGIAVKAGGKGNVTETHVLWSGRQRNRISTPVIHDGRIYTFGGGIATCMDAASGEEIYRKRLQGGSGGGGGRGRGQDYASPVIAGDLIYFPSRAGELFVIQAGDSFLQLAANRVTSDTEDFSATPAVCDGQIFLRSDKHLYCIANTGDNPVDVDAAVNAAKAAAEARGDEEEVVEEEGGRGGRGRGFGGGGGQGGPGGGFDPAEIFRRRDANGDGKLMGDEIDERLRDRIEQVDTDRDGAITQEEFVGGMSRLFGGPGGGQGGGRGFGGGRGEGGGGGRGEGRGRGPGRDSEEQRPDRPQRPQLEEAA
jgi:outer membrane protein assembly factor BamB